MARKGENIRKRKDGRWEGRMTLKSADGAKKVYSVYGHSYQEVKEKMYRSRRDFFEDPAVPSGGPQKSRYPVPPKGADWDMLAKEWLGTVKETKKHSTFVKYQNTYRGHVMMFFKAHPLCGKTDHGLVDDILEKNACCSDSLKKSIRCVLRSVFSYAEERYGLEVPGLKKWNYRKENNRIQVLSETEQSILCRYLTEHMDHKLLGILICITTGLRLGEVCSLKWSDIDFTAGILHIQTTVQRIAVEEGHIRTRLVETTPKTPCSQRDIPLPDILASLLKKYHREGAYIINRDMPMDPRTYQNIWKRCQKAAGIRYKNFHALRHTFATNCIERGIDVKSLSEILGHSNVQTTLNRYVHPSIAAKRAYINSVCICFLNAEYGTRFYKGSLSGVG